MTAVQIDLYDLPPSPPCRAVKMVASLVGAKLNLHFVDLLNGKHLEPEFRKINPFHLVPVINDNGFILSEGNAIMRYLVNKYAPNSKLYPQDLETRAKVDMWMSRSSTTFFVNAAAVLRAQLYHGRQPSEEVLLKAHECLSILNSMLEKEENFLVGVDITLADIALSTSLSEFEMSDFDMSQYAHIHGYLFRVKNKLSPVYAEINDKEVADFKKVVKQALKRN